MNAGPTATRIYDALRALVLAHDFRPGDRLDAALLAERLGSSVTPVRDALNMLTGEGLVETRRAGGFYLPPLDEPALKDMYAFEAQILRLALKEAELAPADPPVHRRIRSYAERVADLVGTVAGRSVNGEHARASLRLAARLHVVRTLEETVIDDAAAELARVEYALDRADRASLRRLWNAWYHRRIGAAARLVRAAYRGR
ncbi:MAG: GntR family transcriptional regulator [Novosphingobium sp.]